jgi:hypothetical protein
MAQVLGNQQQAPKIDVSQAKDMNCSNCNNPYFIQAVMVKKISRFVTGTTNDAVLPIDVFLCGNCGQPLDELLPKEFRKNQPKTSTEAEEKPVTSNDTEVKPTTSKIILEP